MTIRCRQLPPPALLFGERAEHPNPLKGLKASGPFDSGTCPDRPKFLFIFPADKKELANRLFLALRNGIGPFPGTSGLFRFSLEKEAVLRLPEFSVQGLDESGSASAYLAATQAYLATSHPPIDCAFIIHPKTSDTSDQNPYLTSKFPLLVHGIPSQVVTNEILVNEATFQWSAANIALQAFAKMGGHPWAAASRLTEDSIVLGVGRADLPSAEGPSRDRFYGIATAFSHDGLYQGMDLFPVREGWHAYLAGLQAALTTTLTRWRERVGRPVDIVMHVERQGVTYEETDLLRNCLRSTSNELVRSYAVVRLSRADDYLFADDADADHVPTGATTVGLGRDRALLQIGGRSSTAELGRHFMASPWQVQRLDASDGAPPLDALCQHALSMASINWRALNADVVPVSIQYPHLVADLLARFGAAGFEISQLAGLPVLDRPWFL